LLIDTDGSLRVKSDPRQGPYDGADDTLFAVQNNSPKSIAAIPLRGSQAIFAFDGDGIYANFNGTFIYNPPPGGPYGPTGYEGPGVSFSNISPDFKSGTVNFNPPIPPGGSAYFGLENAVQTQCPAISAPQRLRQCGTWGSDTLGQSTSTICQEGCYITSGAMLINYHATKQGSTFQTDPAKLDQWLTANNYFDQEGAEIGYGAAIAEYARANKVNLYYSGLIDRRDDFTLDQYLCNGEPPTLYVPTCSFSPFCGLNQSCSPLPFVFCQLPHWVLATGQTTVNGNDTYSVLDPDDYPNGDTLQGWNYQYSAMELYSDSAAPLHSLYITAHSPVELILTNPNGQETGLDPLSNIRFSGIPQSGYADFSLANDQDHTQAGMPPAKLLEVMAPATGIYDLQAIGTGTGPVTLEIMAFDANGAHSIAIVHTTIVPGAKIDYLVNYSSVPGSQITATPLDTTPPVITLSPSPATLWPPNGKMVPVVLTGTITDDEPGGTGVNPNTVSFKVTDSDGEVEPSGPLSLQSNGNYSVTIFLQASRNGSDANGRSYKINVCAEDNAGNQAAAATAVTVPHDQR